MRCFMKKLMFIMCIPFAASSAWLMGQELYRITIPHAINNGKGDVVVSLVKGDITKLKNVDVIVNAAHPTLAWGDGVCDAIFQAAGGEKLEAYIETQYPAGCLAGGVVATPAFNLEKQGVKYIFHGVGPDCRPNKHRQVLTVANRQHLLSSVYKNCLLLPRTQNLKHFTHRLNNAGPLQMRKIAFPSISTGIFAYPLKDAAYEAINTIGATIEGCIGNCPWDEVVIVLYDDASFANAHQAYKEAMKKYRPAFAPQKRMPATAVAASARAIRNSPAAVVFPPSTHKASAATVAAAPRVRGGAQPRGLPQAHPGAVVGFRSNDSLVEFNSREEQTRKHVPAKAHRPDARAEETPARQPLFTVPIETPPAKGIWGFFSTYWKHIAWAGLGLAVLDYLRS